MRIPDGDRLQDAIDMWHDDSWSGCPGGKPSVSVEQLAYALTVLEPWFRDELLPRRATPKVKVQNRAAPKVDKGSQSLGRKLVYARSGGLCEAGCGSQAHEWHHRKARSLGGTWHASNGMHLCRYCHAWVGEHAIEAGGNGWYLGARDDPASAPMKRFGVWVRLSDDGSFEPYEEVA
jgi:hypothetical protein